MKLTHQPFILISILVLSVIAMSNLNCQLAVSPQLVDFVEVQLFLLKNNFILRMFAKNITTGESRLNSCWTANMCFIVFIETPSRNFKILWNYFLRLLIPLITIYFLGTLIRNFWHHLGLYPLSVHQWIFRIVPFVHHVCPVHIFLMHAEMSRRWHSFRCIYFPPFRVLVLLIDVLTMV